MPELVRMGLRKMATLVWFSGRSGCFGILRAKFKKVGTPFIRVRDSLDRVTGVCNHQLHQCPVDLFLSARSRGDP